MHKKVKNKTKHLATRNAKSMNHDYKLKKREKREKNININMKLGIAPSYLA